MIDDLLDAIVHAREVAKEQRDKSKQYRGCKSDYFKYMFEVCLECASEHEQLAEWLTELKQRREADRWKPITESWPVKNGYYLTTTIHNDVYCDFWNGENFDRTEAVIAWMDLPNPYKSKSEAENETDN